MRKLLGAGLVALLAASAAPASAAVLGADAAACARGDSSVLVRVDGFKARSGVLRVQVYGSNPADFLAKGKKLRRVDVPVTRGGRMDVCVAVPGPGAYAIAVRHDLNGNGDSDITVDGGGISNNPSINIFNLGKPSYSKVGVPVGDGVKSIRIRMQYM